MFDLQVASVVTKNSRLAYIFCPSTCETTVICEAFIVENCKNPNEISKFMLKIKNRNEINKIMS